MHLQWQTLDQPAWQALHGSCDVIERDMFGVKILSCGNGDYIKVFRVKHRISLSRIFNPASIFCSNAEKLHSLGIDTLLPVALLSIPHRPRWAVRYKPLIGETVRTLLKRSLADPSALPENRIAALGDYIAQLHDKGIYFRSLHPGNVVLQPDGNFGLIDVLDCRFRWFGRPLNPWQRERNFQHFFRYEDGKQIESAVRAAYQRACAAKNTSAMQ